MLLSQLKEGWFSKKRPEKEEPRLTEEERALIKRLFPESNADDKMGQDYTFPGHVHAVYGNLSLTFYKKEDELRVSVAHHSDIESRINPRSSPITHTDHVATEDELERIKATMAL